MATKHETRNTNLRLGLSSYTFGWAVGVRGHEPTRPLDETGLLDKCRQHGVTLLQIGDNLPLHTFDAKRIESLARRAAEDGVQLEVGARRLTVERVREYASLARRLDAKLIRFVIDDADYHPSPDAAIAVLREVAPELNGIILGIENHDRFPAATLRSMVEAAGSDRIGVCLDTANSLGAGEGLETVLGTLGPLAVNLHLKDFAIARVPHLMGFAIEGRPVGQGFLDVPRLLQQLESFPRCQTAVLELWTPPEPRLEDTIAKEAAWARESLEFLKPLFR
jgi:sugar phosphate isomerase/epimerase